MPSGQGQMKVTEMAKVESLGGQRKLCVLKFGSSVLEREEDYRTVAQEVYRHIRDGEKIVAVVSALAVICDARFRAEANFPVRLAALEKLER